MVHGDNQTIDLSPVLPGSDLPFQVTIEQENFTLPDGIHSGAFGVYKGLWIFIGGRTNGMHGFNDTDNFPVSSQNRRIYVFNPQTGVTSSRALDDPSSGLSLAQIESLSVTSHQSYQEGTTLYIAGGYGFDTSLNTFTTKSVFTAIDLPGIVRWVTDTHNQYSAINSIQQIDDPVFQITGGRMVKLGPLFVSCHNRRVSACNGARINLSRARKQAEF